MKHLRSIAEIDPDDVQQMLRLAAYMSEVNRRPNPNVPALRGKTICNLFFEDSTRTRLSFETAEKRLSVNPIGLAVTSSSVNKGESLQDTIETISSMGVDAFVIRHRSSGVPWLVSQWTSASIINAGDGWANHPTQALTDGYTIATNFDRMGERIELTDLRIGIIGDIKHSRVARSDIELFTMLGADVTLIAPRTLLPDASHAFEVATTANLDDVIGELDVVYLLRMQHERMVESLVPSLREYSARFGLTAERVLRLKPEAIVMHPGPMNRGVEILVDPSELPATRILDQVSNGIAVRMAVLFELLGTGEAIAVKEDE